MDFPCEIAFKPPPYCALLFRQFRHREGVVMSENGETVSSRQYQRYEFDARASAPYTLDDRFYTVAMHVNVS